jgi:hypothetical protein
MIVSTYTRLVIEDHRAECAGVVNRAAYRLAHRSSGHETGWRGDALEQVMTRSTSRAVAPRDGMATAGAVTLKARHAV